MSHIPYTICRSGTYYHNRRVPKHAVKAYGLFIRQALSKCAEKAEAYAFKVKHTWLISRNALRGGLEAAGAINAVC